MLVTKIKEELESYSKCDNLIIRGLPETTFSERASGFLLAASTILQPLESHCLVESAVITFCHDALNVTVSSRDISTAHRIKGGDKDKPRPVIVRFTNRRVRDETYSSKTKLKDLPIRYYISEHLSRSASEPFFEARKMLREKKLVSTWTQNGQVHVRFTSDMSKRPSIIKTRQDLVPCP